MLTRAQPKPKAAAPATTGANAQKSGALLAGTYIQSSTYAQPIPIVYGTARVAANLIHLVDLVQTKAGNQKKASFKGLGALAGYNYNAAIALGICEGPIAAIALAWKDRDNPTTFAALDSGAWTLFTGTIAQSPWSYLTTHHPDQAVPYQFLAYAAIAGASLPSGNVSAYSWLVQGFLPFGGSFRNADTGAHVTGGISTSAFNTSLTEADDYFDGGFIVFTSGPLANQGFPVSTYLHASGKVTLLQAASTPPNVNDTFVIVPSGDCNPSDVLNDLLTNATYGLGLDSARIASLTTYATYCAAAGLLLSPVYDSQRTAAEIVKELLEMSNAELVWSDGLIKIVPYGDRAITGNGQTFTPNTTPVYTFADDDYLVSRGQDPVQVQRKRPADAYNRVTVSFEDNAAVASQRYAQSVAQAQDMASIQAFGIRDMSPVDYRAIKSPGVAQTVAQLVLQRQQAVRNTYQWKTGWSKGVLLEPMDLVTLTDTALGLSGTTVRVTEVNELAKDAGFEITAEDWTGVSGTAVIQQNQGRSGFSPNTAVDPGNTTAVVFDGPHALGAAPLELWIANSGGINWGGCDIYVSTDNVNFVKVGSNPAPANFGTLTANLVSGPTYPTPDNAHTLSVDLTTSEGVLVSYSATDWGNFVPLCYVGGKFLAYETATLTSAFHYDLTHLYRGLYGTDGGAVASGQPFVFCDEAVFRFPYPQGALGQTVYFKFPSWNVYGRSAQTLAAAPTVSHVIGQVPQIAQATLGVEITQVSASGTTATFTVTIRDPLNAAGTVNVTPSFSGISSLNNDTLGAPAVPYTSAINTPYQFTATLFPPFAGPSGYAKFVATFPGWANGIGVWYTATASQDAAPTMVLQIGNNQSTTDLTAKASALISAPSNIDHIKWIANTSGFVSAATVDSTGATVSGGGPFTIPDLGVTLNLGDTVYLNVLQYDSLGRFTTATFLQGKKTRESVNASKTIRLPAAGTLVPIQPGTSWVPDYTVTSSYLSWPGSKTNAASNVVQVNTVVQFAGFLPVPKGATLTACRMNAYANPGDNAGNDVSLSLYRVGDSGAQTQLGSTVHTTLNATWETPAISSLSEDTSGARSYQVVVQNDIHLATANEYRSAWIEYDLTAPTLFVST